ncbi:hypothetical protein Hdeb2414_s0023g00641361 [Helianthus debilis subsp. tardiflorus]
MEPVATVRNIYSFFRAPQPYFFYNTIPHGRQCHKCIGVFKMLARNKLILFLSQASSSRWLDSWLVCMCVCVCILEMCVNFFIFVFYVINIFEKKLMSRLNWARPHSKFLQANLKFDFSARK